MSETQKRIASAIVLILIVIFAIFSGEITCLLCLNLVGALCLYEFMNNFLGISKRSKRFNWSIFVFLALFLTSYFLGFQFLKIRPFLLGSAIIINLTLLLFLFSKKNYSTFFHNGLKKRPYYLLPFFFFPLYSISSLFYYPNWRESLSVLFFINFSMDTCAWFFGKNFGKTKLWPSISPKKTVEGLLGGAITTSILTFLLIKVFMTDIFSTLNTPSLFIMILILASATQLGDLIESKVKRVCKIKDSSGLIPGHGGIYDRIDGLLFMSPFYVLLFEIL